MRGWGATVIDGRTPTRTSRTPLADSLVTDSHGGGGAGGPRLLFCAEMVYLFYVLIVQQLVQGAYSLWQGVLWLQMCKRRLAQGRRRFSRRAWRCSVPSRGWSRAWRKIWRRCWSRTIATTKFSLPISGVDDPAYRVLEHVAASSKRPVHIVRAGRAKDCGDKVNNLRVAVEQAGREFRHFCVHRFRWAAVAALAGPAGCAAGRLAPGRGDHVSLADSAARRLLERAGFGLERLHRHLSGRAQQQFLLGRRHGHSPQPI